MRLLRIIFQETDHEHDRCYRAERVVTMKQFRSIRDLGNFLVYITTNLEKELEQEIEKHDITNISRPAVCTPPNPETAPGTDEAPGVGR